MEQSSWGVASDFGASLVEQSVIFIRIVTNSPLWSSHVVWKCHSSCGMSTNCALSLIIHKYLIKSWTHGHCCMPHSRHCEHDLSCSWGRDWDARTTIKIYLRFKRWNYLLMLPVANKVDRKTNGILKSCLVIHFCGADAQYQYVFCIMASLPRSLIYLTEVAL